MEQARLIASLRQIGVPLAEVKAMIGLDPESVAKRLGEYWAGAELSHAARRDLVNFLVERLSGKRAVMYEVNTREMPERTLLCLKRHVDGWNGAWAFGEEFIGILKERTMPRMEGIEGAMFSIYHGEVNDDSDGPVEWCRPIPDEKADELASQFPELTLRTEPAHTEAFVHLGPGGQTSSVQWQLVSEVLHSWGADHLAPESYLDVRITYLAEGPRGPDSAPDCDFAVAFC